MISVRTKLILSILVYAILVLILQISTFYIFNKQGIIFSLISIANLFVSLFVTLLVANTFIMSKLAKLAVDTEAIKNPTNSKERLEVAGDDEFADLAQNFNSLLDDSEKFKLAIENSLDFVIMTDPSLKIIYVNKAALDQLGYAQSEIIGQTPAIWRVGDDLDKVKEVIINQKKTFEGEILNKRKNGETYSVEVKISPILDNNNQVKYYVAIEHDVSSAKQLKENLMNENQQISQKIQEQTTIIEEKEAQLLGLVNSISLGFIMFDMNEKLLFVNPAMERITGMKFNDGSIDSVDSLLGKTFGIKEKYQQCLVERRTVSDREIAFNNKFLRLSVAPIYSSKELMTLIGAVILVEDNTQAQNAQRSRDEFFSIASHELRTPLTAIRGNTALLQTYRNRLDQKEVDAMIEDINSASVRLIGIVNDFLDTSRLETGKMTYKKEQLSLAELAQEAIKEYQTTGSLKMLYLTFVPPASPLENVIGDRDRVKQVLINLVGNAVKYTDKGGVIVVLERDNGFIKVLVTDTGTGIPLDVQSGLFNKFQQGPAGETYTRDVIHGSGLGLYISKMMIEGMGGKIALEKSVSGVGSTFSFELPIVKEAIS
jgi:PAS domain S-box-containing protein